jgi:hypothetical protein|tara:strand:- start:591 stop:806 length:216 start_codon:yes stop_codon:yes gene_type:complete
MSSETLYNYLTNTKNMELPINDQELATIVSALRLGGDAALYQKMNTIKEIREANPGGPYKKIAREQFGFVL